jgi:hypothetical protein
VLAAAVPTDITRDHRRITPEAQTDLLVLQALGQASGDSSRSANINIMRPAQILSHRTSKI